MTANPTATLTVDEMSGIFKALRADNEGYSLDDALAETIALTRKKGMSAADFAALLTGAGIDITEPFRQWLEQKFNVGN